MPVRYLSYKARRWRASFATILSATTLRKYWPRARGATPTLENFLTIIDALRHLARPSQCYRDMTKRCTLSVAR